MRRRAKSAATPSILPGYSHLTEIGGGAFATVYRATEDETGREVALKVLKVDTVHPHLVETFQREIQALAKVSHHPNIVTLYRPLQTPDGRPVLVLELCQHSLSQQVRTSGPLAPVDATRAGIKVAGALETAHRSGFLHRDMKPQNILVTSFGEPALADFGVAALQASAQATVGVFGFTTLHAAPEMLEGHHLSPATDVYGLASTMYQLLAGRAPFAAFENEAPASVILRILRDPVRPLYSEGVPLALSDLLEASLSKEPEGRPRTALEFAEALQSVEAAEGWPSTSYVAWGDEGWSEGPGEPPAPPVRDDRPGAGAGSTLGGPTFYQSGPSVHVAGVDKPGRPSLPPLLPSSRPAPDGSPAPPADPPAPSAGWGVAAPADPAPRPAPRRAAPPPPPVPPEPSGPSRSSLAAAVPEARQVVAPTGFTRGQQVVPPAPPSVPLRPLVQDQAVTPQARPVFVDPPAGEPPPGGTEDPTYERTMDAGRLFASSRGPAAPVEPPSGWSVADLPPMLMLMLGFAAAVVIAAALVVAGVI